MKKHKTLLVSCFIENSPQAMPLASGLLQSSVSDFDNLKIETLIFTIDESIDTAFEVIKIHNPDSIGFSVYIWNKPFFTLLIKKIKFHFPKVIIYGGGAEITASSSIIDEEDLFDYLIPGEGELPFRLLMESFLREEYPKNKILSKKHFNDLDEIKSPYLSGILDPRDFDGLLWEQSRGCPFNCSFCCESRGIGGVRYFSEERINEELELFETVQVEQVWVLDPTFNLNRNRALKILNMIKNKAPAIHFTFEVRAELLDEELVEAFSQIHCSLQIGLQSCHERVLKTINRSINKQIFSEKMALLNNYGIVFGLDLIYGLPSDTFIGFKESLDFAIMQIPNHLDIFRLSIFPGTDLYESAGSLNLKFMKEPPYSVISTETFPITEIENAEKLAETADLFYNKGKAAPWLLPVLDHLHINPSDFFLQFQNSFDCSALNEKNITDFQSSFLLKLLQNDHDDKICAVVIDLVQFHNLYNQVLNIHTPQIDTPPVSYRLESVIQRAPNLVKGIFSYDVTLYYELGMFDLTWFINEFEKNVSYGLFFNDNGAVQVMAIEKIYYMFLQIADGHKTINEILSIIDGKANDFEDFIGFLLETNLIMAL